MLIALSATLGLAAAVPLVQATAAEAGVHTVVGGSQEGKVILIGAPSGGVGSPSGFDAFQADVEKQIARNVGGYVQAGAAVASLSGLQLASIDGQSTASEHGQAAPTLMYVRDLARHVEMVSGDIPAEGSQSSAVTPVSLPQRAAATFGLRLGNHFCLRFTSNSRAPFCLRVAGVWSARDANEAFWGGRPPETVVTMGKEALFGLQAGDTPDIQVMHFYVADLKSLHAAEVPAVVAQLHQLRGYFVVERGGSFSTQLDGELRNFDIRRQSAAYTIELVTVAMLVAALYATGFLVAGFLGGQSADLSVLRARGWPRRRIWLVALMQLLVLVLPASALGLIFASLLCGVLALTTFGLGADLIGAAGDLLRAAAPTVLVCLLCETLILVSQTWRAAGAEVLEVRRDASRPSSQPWWRRHYFDLGLGVLALGLLQEARVRGFQQGGDDPLVVTFPALALGLLAVVGLRLLGPIAGLVERLLHDLPASLASVQLVRRPGRYLPLALLLTISVALAVFNGICLATDRQNAIDRADYAVGADVRTAYQTAAGPPRLAAVRNLPGVAGSSWVYRALGSPATSATSMTVLGVDPASLADVAWARSDAYAQPLRRLLRPLVVQDVDGLRLPGRPSELSVWTFASGLSGSLAALVEDDAGRLWSVPLGQLHPPGWRLLQASLQPTTGAPVFPLKLRELTLSQQPAVGQIALSDLAVDGHVVQSFTAADGPWYSRTTVASSRPLGRVPDAQQTREGRETLSIPVDGGSDVSIWPAGGRRPLPVLVSPGLLDDLGLKVGQELEAVVAQQTLRVSVVGTISAFPSTYPTREYIMIAPRDSLIQRLGEGGTTAWPTELWLKTAGLPPHLEEALRSLGPVSALYDRRALEQSTLTDPNRRALEVGLALGFGSMMVIMVLGFGVNVMALIRERLGEYAVMQANGLSQKEIRRSLAIERVVVLIYGMFVGTMLGLACAVVLLPTLHLGSDPVDTIPATTITIQPLIVAGGLTVLLALSLAAGRWTQRTALRFDLLQELRLVA
ncbi:MAG: FtsX-like permease family protein [Candidatus Dormibacter sp.]|uniref:FtsX-like permease family protein n=1 Tax=Candidatus Dormibacter sp. TaxID=2973982 RepID=UPI003D9BE492